MLGFIIADKNQLCDTCFAAGLKRKWVTVSTMINSCTRIFSHI